MVIDSSAVKLNFLSTMMETIIPSRVYHHYAHADSCRFSRWTARESYQFMYARPWEKVNDFYLALVNRRLLLSELFEIEKGDALLTRQGEFTAEAILASIFQSNSVKRDGEDTGNTPGGFGEHEILPIPSEDQSGRWARVTFKIVLSYHGKSFDGWQKQPGLNSVQGLVERSIGSFLDDRKVEQLKDKGLPVEGIAVVAGRTDKGVTALNQVCSFYTWRKDVKLQEIEDAINNAAPGKLMVVSVSQVSRAFHPNFCAKWRRYLYLFPLGEGEEGKMSNLSEEVKGMLFLDKSKEEQRGEYNGCLAEQNTDNPVSDNNELEGEKKPTSFSITRVNKLLQQLEGKLLSYKMFARDTKASRNIGPPTECFLYHARAAEFKLPYSSKDDADATKIMCVELVANRFLRRMVRVLVATAIREAAAGAEEDALLKLMDATCRRATAPPAPPDGLCLVDVGYVDFNPQKCFIH